MLCTPGTVKCVNLLERFGGRYRISWDQAREGRDSSPWLMQIPCRGGITIYPHGGTLLAVEVDHHPHVARRLQELGLKLHQDGDHEKTFLFDVRDFEQVAEVVRPHRRHVWTDEERQVVAQRLAPYQFSSVVDPPFPAPQTAPEALG
jgi:hypothetical protein